MSISEGSVDLAASTGTTGWANISGLVYGRIATQFDSDWFVTYLVAGFRYQIGMQGENMDAFLALRNNAGTLITTANATGVNQPEWITFTPAVSGVYYIDASSNWFSAANTGRYSVIIQSNAFDDFEATTSTRSILSLGVPRQGAIELPADADFHGITLTQGKTYELQLSGTLTNAWLRMTDAGGNNLDVDGAGRLLFTPGWTGQFFVEVSGNRLSDTGSYTLTARELPQLTAEGSTAWEGNEGTSSLTFTLRLSAPSPVPVTVRFSTSDETALAGFDYQRVDRIVTIPANTTTLDVAVPVIGNTWFQPARVLTVNLSEPTNAALATTSVLGQIYDNDTPVGVTLPTDSLAAFQWHLYTVRAHWAWNIATGKGIKVGVLDQGVDRNNADLARNVNLSLGVNASNLQPGGNPIETGDNHGTAVAGVIGAARDGSGVVGVAYEATLVSIYAPLSGSQFIGEIANAFRYARDLDVLNNSWGFGNGLFRQTTWAFYDDAKSPLFAPAFAALKELADLGRKGLGTVVVQSAGNGFIVGDDTNLHNFQNSRYVVTVGATDYFSQVSDFSTTGASILVAAPGGGNDGRYGNILTTDRIGAAGYTESSFAWRDGTSFSAPIVSGIVAMMLEVNPKLGYRDIQQILAMTARKVDTGLGEWGDNGATNWNGGGMHYNSVFHAVGFGQADALAAVRLAAGWDQPPLTSANVKEVSAGTTVQQAIPDGVDSVRSSLSITEKMVVERVDVTVNITHTFIGDLTILLLSPAGTLSYLMWRPAQGSLSAYGSSQDNVRFTFNTVLNWGESSVGTWSIQVSDKERGEVGTFVDWSMTLIGQPDSADDVFVYTNEYPDIVAQDPSRAVLRDTDGGINTINTAALGFGNLIDLTGQSSSALNGAQFSVAPGVKVGTVIGGDGGDVLIASDLVPTTLRGGPGNDLLVGGVLADFLIGGSGDDQLIGGAGNDRLDGGPGNDRLLGDQGFDSAVFPALRSQITVSLQVTAGLMQYRIAGPTIGTDTAAGIERLHFADMSIALDLEGNAGAAVRLVGALFGPQKVSDKSLLGQWIDAIDRGASLATAVTQAVGSAQFAAAAGGRSNADFVNLVYKNVVGTAPDPWSFDYFVGLLNRGEYTQPSLALLAVELELTGQQVGLVGLVNTGVEYIPVVG